MKNIMSNLIDFKLAGIAKTLDSRNKYAIEKQLSYLEFLTLLLEDEKANRGSNSFNKRFNRSKLDNLKTIDSYDFTYQPELT